jgi:ligand-binding sensor domain-containing protein/AraC-like DNA-binding protein
MKHTVRISITVSILFLMSMVLRAQTARLYDSGSGLPSTQINDLFQGGNGMLWIATNNGLYRFDGLNFLEFHHDKDRAGALASDLVLKVMEDSRGVTWVGTSTGLQTFDPETNSFSDVLLDDSGRTHFIYGLEEVPPGQGKGGILVSASDFGLYLLDVGTHVPDDAMRQRFIAPDNTDHLKTIFIDSSSRIWASSEMGGLLVYDTNGKTILEDMWEGTAPEMRGQVIVSAFAEHPGTGDIIIGTSNFGILVFEAETGRLRIPSDRASRDCKVMSLLVCSRFSTQDGETVIVGTENQGLKQFSPETRTLSSLSLPNVPYHTDSWKVHGLMEDSQGNLWVSAYQTGLMIVPQSMFGFRHYGLRRGEGPGDEGVSVTSAFREYEKGRIWVGSDGGGIFCIPGDGRTVNYNSGNSGLPGDSVMDITVDKRGTLWIATFMDGLVTYREGKGFKPFRDNASVGTERTYCLNYDSEKDILYVGTHGNGIVVVDPASETMTGTIAEGINRWVNSITFDSAGTMWIATFDGHWCYDPESGQLSRADLKDPALMNARTYSIAESKDGTIWMGTGEGLVRLDRGSGEAGLLTVRDGLSSNVISGILEGNDGSIWVSTSYGLTRIDPQTGQMSRYYEYDGLQGNEFNIGAIFKSRRGQLYFGGTKGMTSFFPRAASRELHEVPPVLFTRLTVASKEVEYVAGSESNILDKDIMEAERIVLPYSSNSFSLEYSVPEFTNPERIRYSYMLSRFDHDWKTASAQNRTATYTNLPHGRYTLTVKAHFDGDEENSSVRSINVRVLPPWWLSFWAFLLYAALLSGIIAMIILLQKKNRLHRQQKEESELKEAKIKMFTNISHEIRTPLNLVLSPLRKLMESDSDPDRRESYGMMYRNAFIILDRMNEFEESRRLELAAEDGGTKVEESYSPPEDTDAKVLKSRKNLLLVDENAEMRRYLRMELRKHFNIETCSDADEAWAKVVATLPDAVVTDIITGGSMDGTDLCEKIRRNPTTSLIPVLILTSQWDDDTIRRCTESGADRHLVKPVPVDLLRSTVQQLISTREAIRNKYTNDVTYDYGEITISSADDTFLPRTVEIIKANIGDPDFGVEELSREIGMSRVHLNRKLKETISLSPGTFIKSIRLKQAAYLLVNNKVNISEVAYKVGFSTHSYFSSTFKDYFGLPPKEFVAKYSDPAKKEELDRLLKI